MSWERVCAAQPNRSFRSRQAIDKKSVFVRTEVSSRLPGSQSADLRFLERCAPKLSIYAIACSLCLSHYSCNCQCQSNSCRTGSGTGCSSGTTLSSSTSLRTQPTECARSRTEGPCLLSGGALFPIGNSQTPLVGPYPALITVQTSNLTP